jgi:hypothetical protein
MMPYLHKVYDMSSPNLQHCREVLALWLQWNDAHEQATQAMFEAAGDPGQVEQLMDQLDVMRRQAVEASRKILDAPRRLPPKG